MAIRSMAEFHGYTCPGCGNLTLVRHERTGYCMPCYIPSQLKQRPCPECAGPVAKENPGKVCLRCLGKKNKGKRDSGMG